MAKLKEICDDCRKKCNKVYHLKESKENNTIPIDYYVCKNV